MREGGSPPIGETGGHFNAFANRGREASALSSSAIVFCPDAKALERNVGPLEKLDCAGAVG